MEEKRIQKCKKEKQTRLNLKPSKDISTQSLDEEPMAIQEDTDDDSDEEYSQGPPGKKKNGGKLILAGNILEETVKVAVRYGLSINQHLGMVAGIIIAGGGNLDDYSLSQATAVRAKNKVLGNVGERIKKIL